MVSDPVNRYCPTSTVAPGAMLHESNEVSVESGSSEEEAGTCVLQVSSVMGCPAVSVMGDNGLRGVGGRAGVGGRRGGNGGRLEKGRDGGVVHAEQDKDMEPAGQAFEKATG